jgi:hypothetical protein
MAYLFLPPPHATLLLPFKELIYDTILLIPLQPEDVSRNLTTA